MTGDLLVPGTPTLRTNGNLTFTGTVVGTRGISPTGYPITLNGDCSLHYPERGMENRVNRCKSHRSSPLCRRKTGGGLEKGLANLWSRKSITKKACAGRGQETKWDIPV